jgi:hypothetical protein
MTKLSRTTRIYAQRRAAYFDPLITRNFDQAAPLSFHTSHGGNYGSRRTSLAARRSNPDHHPALSLLALSLPACAVKAQAEHPMSTAKQFRAKAAESAESLKRTVVPSEIREFQRSISSFEALADNEDWLANNFDKIVHSTSNTVVCQQKSFSEK